MQPRDNTHGCDEISRQPAMPLSLRYGNRKSSDDVGEMALLDTRGVDDPIPPFARKRFIVRQIERNAHSGGNEFTRIRFRHAQVTFRVTLQELFVVSVVGVGIIEKR